MTRIVGELRRFVAERAGERCEYCLLPRIVAYPPHEVDHIYAEKHGGGSTDPNLCFSCYDCNHYKGTDLASLDPETGEPVFLFHPRRDIWTQHFRLLQSGRIEPLSAVARATARLLHFNDYDRIAERAKLILLGKLP